MYLQCRDNVKLGYPTDARTTVNAVVKTANRRQFQRISLEGDVRVYSERAMWTTKLIDISLRGAMIQRPEGWDGQRGRTQRLDIRLGNALTISASASVAHCSRGRRRQGRRA